MRIPTLLLFATLLLAAGGCKDEPAANGALELQFHATYEGEPLQIFDQAYPYPGDMQLRMQRFQFYISDIALLKAGNEPAQAVSEVELVDFSDLVTAEEARAGVTLRFDDVPTGEYTGIRFGLGVSPDLNGMAPANFRQPHPLNDANYWSWATGYVYGKIEGNADTSGTGTFPLKLSYHIGADSLYTVVDFAQPLTIRTDAPGRLSFTTDLYDLLVNGNTYIDFRDPAEQLVHANKPHLHSFIWRNLVRAMEQE